MITTKTGIASTHMKTILKKHEYHPFKAYFNENSKNFFTGIDADEYLKILAEKYI